MNRRSLLLSLVGMVVVLAAFPGSSAGTAPKAAWNDAIETPGLEALNVDGGVAMVGVSCAAVGDCASGGWYKDSGDHYQAFLVNEKKSVWGTAEEVPGTAALNVGNHAILGAISCGGVGDCAAGGTYTDGSAVKQAWVVSEKKGVWGTAVEVPGTAALNVGGNATVEAISCVAPGACAAGGVYTDGAGFQGFVVTEKKGVWGSAAPVPQLVALNVGGDAQVRAISCGAVGDCVAGGFYRSSAAFEHYEAFVVREKKGVWGKALKVPGTSALDVGNNASLTTISCVGAGECAASGSYVDGSATSQAFVVSEKNGVWRKAAEVPGAAALGAGEDVVVSSISCSTPGECAVGGYYLDASDHGQPFVANETKGKWRRAVEVPGAAALNAEGDSSLHAVSCGGVGECSGGGWYEDGGGNYQAYVVSEEGGVWRTAHEVPGTPALNAGANAAVNGVSCSGIGDCAAVGSYADGSGHFQGFVTNVVSPCVVPNVVGETLRAAKQALAAYHCRAGKIRSVYARRAKGRVVAQHPKPGTHRKRESKVALTVSKGRKPKS